MAITWDTEFTITDFDKNLLRVTGTRTDDSDGSTWTYSLNTKIEAGEVAAGKAAILASLQGQHTEAMAIEDADTAFLDGWKTQLDAALDAWEIANA
jgi:hypothetical protein